MRFTRALRSLVVEPRMPLAACVGVRGRCHSVLPGPVLAAAMCAGLLAGCCDPEFAGHGYTMGDTAHAGPLFGSSLKIPLPGQALLAAQSAPNCEYNASRGDNGPGQRQKSQSDIDEAYRVKLEHERECYREAEMRARQRLQHLQTSIGKTINAVNRREQGGR